MNRYECYCNLPGQMLHYPVKMLGLDQRGRLYKVGTLVDCPLCRGREETLRDCQRCGGEGIIYAMDATKRRG